MSDIPMCRDCADFGPVCPNSGKPCAASPLNPRAFIAYRDIATDTFGYSLFLAGWDAALATPATEPAAPGYVSDEQIDALRRGPLMDKKSKREFARAVLAAASTVQGKEKP